MLGYMNTVPDVTTLMLALAATSDPLRQLAAADDFRASLFNTLVERGHRITGHGQVLAAHAAQRALVHELDDARLTAIDAALETAGAFASGATDLPAEDYAVRTGKPLYRDTANYLSRRLHITHTEAGNRLASATLLLPGIDDFGVPRPPLLPLLGGLLKSAQADPGNLTSAARKLAELHLSSDRLPDGPAIATDHERAVAESVRTQDARGTRCVLQQLEAGLEAAALDPSPEELRSRQGMFFVNSKRGLDEWKVLCTTEQSEVLLTCFDTINNPRLKANKAPADGSGEAPALASTPVGGDWSDATTPAPPSWYGTETPDPKTASAPRWPGEGAQEAGSWESTTAQRRLELLITACHGELSGTPNGGPKRPRTQIVVSIDYRSLLGQLEAAGTTAHGAKVSPATIRRMACDAEVIPALLDTNGRILDLGRSTRKFPPHQRVAISHRDRGCVFPGCTEPPEHCEIHHVEFWRNGGVTSVDNGALLCVSHHHLAHVGGFELETISGMPYVLPPSHIDPVRRPVRNTFWHPELIGDPHPPGDTLHAA